jgi:hypothetical protein
LILDHYPEIGFFRDLIFMFKLVMVPTSDKLPELKPWTPQEAALKWSFDNDVYIVTGFNRKLDCEQVKVSVEENQVQTTKKGFFRSLVRVIGINTKSLRSVPSQANQSILVVSVSILKTIFCIFETYLTPMEPWEPETLSYYFSIFLLLT